MSANRDTDLFGPTINTTPTDGDKGRAERGAYFTPDALALAISKTIYEVDGWSRSILEPGCGGGAFLRAADDVFKPEILRGVDLEPMCTGPGTVMKQDLFSVVGEEWELVLGNPDYSIAEKAMRHCMTLLLPGGLLAFLLRSAFLGSTARVPLYREFPIRYLQPIAQRPSFTADGKTDPMEYSVFVWQRGWTGRGELLPPLMWR